MLKTEKNSFNADIMLNQDKMTVLVYISQTVFIVFCNVFV